MGSKAHSELSRVSFSLSLYFLVFSKEAFERAPTLSVGKLSMLKHAKSLLIQIPTLLIHHIWGCL